MSRLNFDPPLTISYSLVIQVLHPLHLNHFNEIVYILAVLMKELFDMKVTFIKLTQSLAYFSLNMFLKVSFNCIIN